MIQIRAARESDLAEIEALHRAAFGGDYEALIVRRIPSEREYIPKLSIVAIAEDGIVGHVLVTWLHHENLWEESLVAIGPIGVMPSLQRQGIGSKLMEVAIGGARALQARGIVLVGHPEYYPRFGFRPASTWGIRLPLDAPDEAVMALELSPDSLKDAVGTAYFSRAFDAPQIPTEPRASESD